MNVSSPVRPSQASAASEVGDRSSSVAAIDRSTWAPITFFFTKGIGWLVIALIFGAICSIKLHAPNFLADYPWLTYGRVRPAFNAAFLFGFASQVGLATALWLLARLGRTVLQGPGVIFIAGAFWNLGVTLGVIGILAGGATGLEWWEMPGYATPILVVSYFVIGVCAVLTFHARREPELYPSQWYVLGALLWFPWVSATALLLLTFSPVPGVLQAVIAGWSVHNLFSLWLTPLGLAVIFYFLPKLTNQPLYSRALAAFGFWALALFGALGGVPPGSPVPRWLPGVSTAGTVLSSIAVLAVATNWHLTIQGAYRNWKTNSPFRFILFGAVCYVIASALQIFGAHRVGSDLVRFTLFEPGVTQLHLLGFLGMSFSGALYYIVPRVTNTAWPSPGLMNFHFWTGAIGTALTAGALILGGLFQGQGFNDANSEFLKIVRSTVPFLGLSTLGGLLLLAGYLALAVSLVRLKIAAFCSCCCPSVKGGKRA